VEGSCVHGNELSGSIKCWEVLAGARGSVVVKALCCKPEGRGFKS
jgi:hypothetical protein